jgi:integrase
MPEVNLTKRIRLADGTTRFCPVVIANNGKVKPGWVLVDGREELHNEAGSYYLDWHEDGKRVRQSVGTDAQQASAKRRLQEGILAAKQSGMKDVAGLAKIGGGDGMTVVEAVATFLEDLRLNGKKPKTQSAYKTMLTNYFLESCKKQRMAEITRRDLLQFAAFLREQGLSPRTVYNKFEQLMSFLKANKITGLVGKNDWPRYTEEEPEVYERAELDKFFAACDATERLWFEFFLMTGMREQEVMHCGWADVNLNRGAVTVRWKPEYGFQPKQYKEREIPIPQKLVDALKVWKGEKEKGCGLLFPTRGCRPKNDFLDCCKVVAKRAGLDADNFWLHKFRSTFATTALWNGVDLRTVQSWMGHTDMESTMRYLKPNRSAAVKERVEAMWD